MKFPTGGKVRERIAQNRCNSDTDSKVWMEEALAFHNYALKLYSGHFLWGERDEKTT